MRIPQLKSLRFYSIALAFLTIIFFITKNSAAQESEAYEKKFKEKFPSVAAPMWIRKADDTYEATFKLNGAFVSSVYTVDGKWLFNKSPVDSGQIPTLVKTAIAKKHTGAKITFAEKIETADKGVQYKIALKTGTKRNDVLFDEQGNFLK